MTTLIQVSQERRKDKEYVLNPTTYREEEFETLTCQAEI